MSQLNGFYTVNCYETHRSHLQFLHNLWYRVQYQLEDISSVNTRLFSE